MAGKLPKCEGLITVPTGAYSVSVQEFTPNAGPASVTVAAAGNYYLTSTTALLSTISSALTANATLGGTYSCTLDDGSDTSTGKVTISATGVTTFNLTWTSTALRDLLGFTGNLTGAASYTGTYQARYLWLPNVGRTGVLAPEQSSTSYYMGARERDAWVTVAPSGYIAAGSYSTRYVDTFQFQRLKGSKTWIANEATVNESLEKFYADVIGEYVPFRYHPTRDDDTLYFTSLIDNPQQFRPVLEFQGNVGANSWWSVSYQMRPYVNV